MSDIADKLETLSNAELRDKLKEQGLPNTPVTDSSRSVLIKRLRASLSGSPLKKPNRRETIAAPKAVEEPATKNKVSDNDADAARPPSRNRRTLGAVANDELPPSQPAPIAARRRSVMREKAATKTATGGEDFPPIIIEDDDDDVELVLAVENAEKINEEAKKTAEPSKVTLRGARAGSLGKSAVQVTSYRQTTTPIKEQVTAEAVISSSNEVPSTLASSRNTVESHYAGLTSAMQPPTRSTLGYEPSTRYTTSYTSRYSGNQPAANYYSTLRNPPAAAAPVYDEYSDDNEAVKDDIDTPFLSSFARNLERIKSEGVSLRTPYSPLGGGADPISGRYKRSSVHERHGRQKSLKQSFEELMYALDRKYELRRNLVIFAAFVLAVVVYVVFLK